MAGGYAAHGIDKGIVRAKGRYDNIGRLKITGRDMQPTA
jgi:hypothetical protein